MLNVNLKGKKALLFDVDGTIADTMASHNKAYELAFYLNEVPFNMEKHKYWAPFGGRKLMEETVIKIGFEHRVDSIIADKQRLLPICLDKFMRPNKDLIDFIKLNDHLQIAFVSNGRRKSIEHILGKLGLMIYADYITTSDILGSPKPSPEAYNYTMLMLGVKPEEAVAFEDNRIGFDSAWDAGIRDIVEVKTNEF